MISTLRMNKDSENANDSPFSIKSNSSQRTKYFMIYSLNIGGVKRWLTLANDEDDGERSNSLSSYRNNHKSQKSEEEDKQEIDKGNMAWWMTSVLANRLLSPEVSSSEKREYKKYINQYKSGTYMNNHQYNTNKPERHPEYKYLQKYIRRGDCSYQSLHHSIDKKDEKIYMAYLDINKISTLTSSSSKVPGMQGSGLAKKRYNEYSRWITTGKYPIKIPGVSKTSSNVSSSVSKSVSSHKHYRRSVNNLSNKQSFKKLQRSSSA